MDKIQEELEKGPITGVFHGVRRENVECGDELLKSILNKARERGVKLKDLFWEAQNKKVDLFEKGKKTESDIMLKVEEALRNAGDYNYRGELIDYKPATQLATIRLGPVEHKIILSHTSQHEIWE